MTPDRSTLHVDDDLRPSRHRTMCGLPHEGRLVAETPLPVAWEGAVTCDACRRAVIACMSEGRPR